MSLGMVLQRAAKYTLSWRVEGDIGSDSVPGRGDRLRDAQRRRDIQGRMNSGILPDAKEPAGTCNRKLFC